MLEIINRNIEIVFPLCCCVIGACGIRTDPTGLH